MSSNSEHEDLKSRLADYSVAATRGAANLVPIVGPVLAEVLGVVIPQQRIDRIAKFAEELERRLSSVEINMLKSQLNNGEFTDLIEEGFRQAARSLSDERRQYIASLIINSLSSENISYAESRHLLRILDEVNDIEIIWLRFYREATMGGDKEFWETHKNVLEPVPVAAYGSSQETLDKHTLQESYKEHLFQLRLFERRYRMDHNTMDHNTKEPVFDEWTGTQKVEGYEITSLGRLLLKEIGLGSR